MLKRLYKKLYKDEKLSKHLVGYVVIIVLAILTNMIGYGVTIRNLKKVISDNNQNSIDLIKTVCDNFFYEIESAAYKLHQSGSVRSLAGSKPDDFDRQRLTKDIIREMNASIEKNSVDTWSIIIKDMDICVTNSMGITDIGNAYDMLYFECYNSKDEWLDSISSVVGMKLFLKGKRRNTTEKIYTETSANYNNMSPNMYFLYRIPSVHDIIIMATVNQKQLSNLLLSNHSDNETALIMSNDNVVLSCDNSSKLFAQNRKIDLDSYNNNYIISKVSSEIFPISYVRFVSQDMYFKMIKRTRSAFVFGHILCVCITGALAYLFSKLSKRREEMIILKVNEERRKMSLNSIKQVLISDVNNDQYAADLCRETLNGKCFTVILFDFDTIDENESESSLDINILNKYLTAKFDGFFGDSSAVFCTIDQLSVGVLNFYKTNVDFHRLKNIVEQVCVFVGNEFKINIQCAVSDIVDDVVKLNNSYEQAKEIINLRFLGDDKIVYVYEDVIGTTFEHKIVSGIQEKLYDSIVNSDNADAASNIVSNFFNFYANKEITINEFRIFMAEIVSVLLKVIAEKDLYDSIDCMPLYTLINNIQSVRQINEAKKTIIRYINDICVLANTRESGEVSQITEDIKEYIDKNYGITDLNVNLIADAFGMNRTTLSKRFKMSEGTNLSEYIVRYRLQKAKELLRTNYSVPQIVKMTGFTSTVVFYRAFKKYECITPSEYRNLKKQV